MFKKLSTNLFSIFTFFALLVLPTYGDESEAQENAAGPPISNSSASTNPDTIDLIPINSSICVGEKVTFKATLNHFTSYNYKFILKGPDGQSKDITSYFTSKTNKECIVPYVFEEEGSYTVQCSVGKVKSNISEIRVFKDYIITINKSLICVGETLIVKAKPCNSGVTINSFSVIPKDTTVLSLIGYKENSDGSREAHLEEGEKIIKMIALLNLKK